MEITITVRDRIASVRDAPIPEPVCGNSDYVLRFDWDSEWNAFEDITCCIICYLDDGEQRYEIPAASGTVSLPVLHNAYAVEIGLTAGDLRTTTPARLPCLACITDGNYEPASEEFDVYNSMTEYIAGALRGTHTSAELAVMYQELLDHMNDHPDPEEFPSEEYRAAIAAPQRITRITGKINLRDGTEKLFSDADIDANTLSFRTDCMTDDVLLPGGVPSAELAVSLRWQDPAEDLYGAEIAPIYQLLLPNGIWYEVPLGVFTISAADSTVEKHVNVTANDDMEKLSGILFTALGLSSDRAYSAKELVEICADAIGIEVVYDGIFESSATYYAAKIGNRAETARDLLMFAVQTMCAIAYVDRFRKLRVKRLSNDDPVAAMTETQRKTLTAATKQYRLFRLVSTFTYPDKDGNEIVDVFSDTGFWPDGITAELHENPLYTVLNVDHRYIRSAISAALRGILWALDPIVFHPLTADTFDDPAVEPLEWRTFTRGENSYTAPITAISWTYHGDQTLTACGADAIAGMLKTQAEKQALAARLNASAAELNFWRQMYLVAIQTGGHLALKYHTHEWIAHFTQGELSGEELTT